MLKHQSTISGRLKRDRYLVHVGSPGYFLLEHFMTAHHEITTPFPFRQVMNNREGSSQKNSRWVGHRFTNEKVAKNSAFPNNSQEQVIPTYGGITPEQFFVTLS